MHDSATEGVMPTPHARAVYFTVLRGNLMTKLYLPKFPTCRNCPALPYYMYTLSIEGWV